MTGEYTDTITNTYKSPPLSITVGKDWVFPQGVNGDLLKTEVTLTLKRLPLGSTGSPVKVQDIVLDGIVDIHEQEHGASRSKRLP